MGGFAGGIAEGGLCLEEVGVGRQAGSEGGHYAPVAGGRPLFMISRRTNQTVAEDMLP